MDRNQKSVDIELLYAMIEACPQRMMSPDSTVAGYSWYKIEVGDIGFNISAKRNADFDWVIRTWTTYNA